MSRYQVVWVTVTAVAVTVGACAALLTWSAAGVMATFASVAVVGGFGTFALAPEDNPRPWRRACLGGAVTGIGVVATGGLLVMLQGVAVPALLAIAFSSPPVAGWLRRKLRAPGVPEMAPTASPDVRGDLSVSVPVPIDPGLPPASDGLDDAALCWAWRRSYVVLQTSRSTAAQLLVVQVRQQYLDELERRNPSGLSTWLESGARAAGNPSRFILHPRPPGTHDADEGPPESK